MIEGIGVDVVHLPDFRAQLADPASTFVAGTFTPGERAASQDRASGDPVRHLGARYAAKEAFIKAWSSARRGQPPALAHVDMREIEVTSDLYARPSLILHGQVAAALEARGPYRLHLSLSHDGPIATAFVILERSREMAPGTPR